MAESITTREMHCGGEPVRIVESGYPLIPEDTLLNMRKYVKENLDHLRRLLMLEPRGHADMYGALLLKSNNSANLHTSVLFMHNSGYSTMCGHATIALARYLADRNGRTDDEETEIRIEAPCGPIRAFVGVGGEARFVSVEAYVAFRDVKISLSSDLTIAVNVAYGGAYYAVVSNDSVGIKFGQTTINEMIDLGMRLKKAVTEAVNVKHPLHADLSFLYGVIFVDDSRLHDSEGRSTSNVTIFAEGQVDRSPTGSGVTARMALLHESKKVARGEAVSFVSGVTNSRFTGRVVEELIWCQLPCVKVEVGGKAFYTGRGEFEYEPDDPLAFGFRI